MFIWERIKNIYTEKNQSRSRESKFFPVLETMVPGDAYSFYFFEAGQENTDNIFPSVILKGKLINTDSSNSDFATMYLEIAGTHFTVAVGKVTKSSHAIFLRKEDAIGYLNISLYRFNDSPEQIIKEGSLIITK